MSMIKDLFKSGKVVVSFEVFPPKRDDDISKLYKTIEELKVLKPDFVSVTYGAGGSTRDKSVEIASTIKNKMGIETMAHLTCVNSTVDDIARVLEDLKKNNIENILALRGDPPSGQDNFSKTIGGFGYAYELVEYIRKHNGWTIAAAGYPEGHIEIKDFDKNIEYLKMKTDKGVDFIVTQLFLENNDFYRFRDLSVKKGIKIPIVPGIFPILNFNAIQKITSLCGSKIPADIFDLLEKNKENPSEIEKIGIDHAKKQAMDLICNDIPGIHFYTMNKSSQIKEIYNSIKDNISRITC
jgi:methylenetetrahydrofolate reductase (NADPH)